MKCPPVVSLGSLPRSVPYRLRRRERTGTELDQRRKQAMDRGNKRISWFLLAMSLLFTFTIPIPSSSSPPLFTPPITRAERPDEAMSRGRETRSGDRGERRDARGSLSPPPVPSGPLRGRKGTKVGAGWGVRDESGERLSGPSVPHLFGPGTGPPPRGSYGDRSLLSAFPLSLLPRSGRPSAGEGNRSGRRPPVCDAYGVVRDTKRTETRHARRRRGGSSHLTQLLGSVLHPFTLSPRSAREPSPSGEEMSRGNEGSEPPCDTHAATEVTRRYVTRHAARSGRVFATPHLSPPAGPPKGGSCRTGERSEVTRPAALLRPAHHLLRSEGNGSEPKVKGRNRRAKWCEGTGRRRVSHSLTFIHHLPPSVVRVADPPSGKEG